MRFFAVIIIVAVLFAFPGCGSSDPENKVVDTVSEPGITQPPPPDSNTVVGNNPRDPKNKKPRPVNPPGPPSQPSEPKPAAENSEVSAMMNEDGSITEFRIFKDHPRIAKVEANWMDPRSKNLKVFLKNGKILQAKTDQIPYLHEATSEQILRIVGVK